MHDEHHSAQHSESAHGNENNGFEHSDLRPTLVFVSGIVLAVVVTTAFFIGVWVTTSLRARTPIVAEYEPAAIAQQESEGWQSPVRLQDNPGAFLRQHEQREMEALNSFGVVSDDPAIYRIPIDEAIDLVVNRGLPEFNALGDAEASGQTQ